MRLAVAGWLACLVAPPAVAQPVDPAEAFGARESIESISLSPDGRRIAYVAPLPAGQGARLFTVDLASGQSVQATAVDGVSQRFSGCTWVSNERLLCELFALRRVQNDVAGGSGFAALNADGSGVMRVRDVRGLVSWLPGSDGVVLMSGFTGVVGRLPGLGVLRMDTRTGRSSLAEQPIQRASRYFADGQGRVRLYSAVKFAGETWMRTGEIEYRYRPSDSGDWRPFSTFNDATREGMQPLAVDGALNVAYALEKLNGRLALYRVSLDGSLRKEMLVDSDTADVDGVLRIGRHGRVIGATYAEDTRQAVYFDPEMRQLAANVARNLPNLPLIRFVGASDDENILLIWAGSDRDPGRYFTYDKRAQNLSEIMLARPQLENVPLAEMRPVRFPAADGTMIPGYLTLPPGATDARGLPAIVMPHGGPDARDEWGFDWFAQYLAHRGYAVLQPNFRGGGGYGDAWFMENGFRSWPVAVGDVSDAGRWLVAQGADPAKLSILGWSYGGYAALQAAAVSPDLFKAVVAVAPVTDLEYLREEARGWSDFRVMREFIGSGPHVRDGSPSNRARSIRAPVLMFHGDTDANVPVRHSTQMDARLRDVGGRSELIVYRGLDHQLEDSAARADMLRRTDAFLRSSLGIR